MNLVAKSVCDLKKVPSCDITVLSWHAFMFSGMHDNADPSMPDSDSSESATMSTYNYDLWLWWLGYKRLDLQQGTKLCRKTVPAASLSITRL